VIVSKSASGTQGWIEERSGVLSASELGELVKLDFSLRQGEGVQTLLARKLAEKWAGPLTSTGGGGFAGSWAMEQGQILETQAVPWLEFAHGVTVERPGFLMTDDKTFGATPDGIIGGDTGLEIKCFQPVNHVRTLLDGEVPREHLAQIHGGLYVTGFQKWQFLAYNRSFPKLLLTVERDEEICARIASAVDWFNEYLDKSYARLVDMNGGEPPKREPMQFASDYVSELPT